MGQLPYGLGIRTPHNISRPMRSAGFSIAVMFTSRGPRFFLFSMDAAKAGTGTGSEVALLDSFRLGHGNP